MFKIEYTLSINDKNFSFYKENQSLETLKRNMQNDILLYSKKNNLKGEVNVEAIILYNEEYYDMDSFSLNISLENETIELLTM